jgi:hypothetical protein
VAYISGYADWFYGTISGPWWYHAATSVPRARNLPFSLLRMLILCSVICKRVSPEWPLDKAQQKGPVFTGPFSAEVHFSSWGLKLPAISWNSLTGGAVARRNLLQFNYYRPFCKSLLCIALRLN